MSPRSLRYLLAVAEYQSFTRAAEVLYVSQPTLSHQIKQLEEALRVQLLDRSGRVVKLTDAGEVYVRHARRALQELDAGKRAIHDLQDLSRGSLRLAMTPITDYMATPLLEGFTSRYPQITLHLLEMCQEQIEAGVASDNIDLGITFSGTLSNDSRSNDIEKRELFVEGLNLVVGKTHRYAKQKTPLSANALGQEPLVLLSSNFALRRHVDSYCDEHKITPHIAVETNSVSVIVEMVRRGQLATILPHMIATDQGLCPINVTPELPRHTVTLICRKSAYKTAACRAFGALAVEWCMDRRGAVQSLTA